jgi:hypothetical protein
MVWKVAPSRIDLDFHALSAAKEPPRWTVTVWSAPEGALRLAIAECLSWPRGRRVTQARWSSAHASSACMSRTVRLAGTKDERCVGTETPGSPSDIYTRNSDRPHRNVLRQEGPRPASSESSGRRTKPLGALRWLPSFQGESGH